MILPSHVWMRSCLTSIVNSRNSLDPALHDRVDRAETQPYHFWLEDSRRSSLGVDCIHKFVAKSLELINSTPTMISTASAKPLTSKPVSPKTKADDTIVAKFRRYFSLFDGRREINPSLYLEVDKAIRGLFEQSGVDEQLNNAKTLFDGKVTIKIQSIARCSSGRVFYHIKVTSTDEPGVLKHITGFATANSEGRVTRVDTKVTVVHC